MEENKYFSNLDDFKDTFNKIYNELENEYKPSQLDVIKEIKLQENERNRLLKYSINNNGKREEKTVNLKIPQEANIKSSIVLVGEGNKKGNETGSLVVKLKK